MKLTTRTAILAVALGIQGAVCAANLTDDFETDTSGDYTGSDSFNSGGSFTVSGGTLNLTAASNNTFSIVHTTSSLEVGESYSLDMLDPWDGSGNSGGNDGQFLMLTTGTGQPNGSSSFGFRLRLDNNSVIRLQTLKSDGNTIVSTSVAPSAAAPDTLWIDRISATDFEFYYGPAGSRTLITTGSLPASDAANPLRVGFQAFSASGATELYNFDKLQIGPIAGPGGPAITSFSASSEILTGPGPVTFTWSTLNAVSATLNGDDVTSLTEKTVNVTESGDYTLEVTGADSSTVSSTITVSVIAEVTTDDFETDSSANYTGSDSFGGGGSFDVSGGTLNLTAASGNTYSVVATVSSLEVGESYSIDALDGPAGSGNSGGGDAMFLMLTTGTGQPNGSSSFGFRLRVESNQSVIRLATYSNGGSTLTNTSVAPTVAPDTFWIDRTSATDFEFYYGPAGSRTLITTGSLLAPEVTGPLRVGVQAFSTSGSEEYNFDKLRVGPATWPSIISFSASSEMLTGPGSVTFTWSTHNAVSATLNGVDVTGQSPLTLTVNESGDYTLEILGTDGSTTSRTIRIDVTIIPPFNFSITPSTSTPGAYDFTWDSQPGYLYDLLSSTDLSIPPGTWPVWDGNAGVPASPGTTTTLTAVPSSDPRRFFVVKRDVPGPWTMAGIGDTQVLVQTAAGRQVFSDNTQWLADNQASLNLAFVTQLGDIVQWGKYGGTTRPPSSTDNVDEWNGADAAMSNLDGVVGWGTATGNHELDWVDVIPGTTPGGAWLTPTPPSGFEAWKARFGPVTTNRYAAMPEFGGVAPNDIDTYFKYTAAGRDYLHLHLQVDIPDDTIAWAQGVIDANPGLPTIISTHVFEGTAHGPPNNPYLSGPGRNSANAIWDKLIKDNSQIFMVLGGHTGQQQRQTRTNTAGESVFTIVQDYAGSDGGGSPAGYLRLYEFDEENGMIHVTTYSPTLDTYLTGSTHEFDLPLDFDARLGVAP
jgi:hypothetical protein